MWKKPTTFTTKDLHLEGNTLRIRQGISIWGKWVEASLAGVIACETTRDTFVLRYSNAEPVRLRLRPVGDDGTFAIRLLIYTLAERGVPIYLNGEKMDYVPTAWGPITKEEVEDYCRTMTAALDRRLAVYERKYAKKGLTLHSWTTIGEAQSEKYAVGAQYVVAAFTQDGYIARCDDGGKMRLMIWNDDLIKTSNKVILAVMNGETLLDQRGAKSFERFWENLDENEFESSRSTAAALAENLIAPSRTKEGWISRILEMGEEKRAYPIPGDALLAEEWRREAAEAEAAEAEEKAE